MLSLDDKKELAAQFAMQIVRTRYFRNYYQEIYSTVKRVLPQAELPEYEKNDFRRIHTSELCEFRMANFYANLLEDRNWVFLINHTRQPFFTSDNPAIFINNSLNPMQSLSPVSEEMTFFIPFSPTVAVELYSKNIVKKAEAFFDIYLEKNVQWYNVNLKANCVRFMMSNQSDFSYIKGSDKQHESTGRIDTGVVPEWG